MFFLLPLLSQLGSVIGAGAGAVGGALGSAGSAIGSGIGSAASSVGSGLLSAGKGITGPLLTKGGAAASPASVGMTGGMSELPAVAGNSQVSGLLKGLADTVVPGAGNLLSKGNFMGNFGNMVKDPKFLNYMMRSKLLPEPEDETQPRRYS